MNHDNTTSNGKSPDPRDILERLEHLESKGGAAQDDEAPSLKTIIREQATDEDMTPTKNITLGKILGGDILNTEAIRKQVWLILLICIFIVVYISNRYKCQQDLIVISKLTEQLKDAKYRALSSNSELTQQTRESMVLERLRDDKDSTLNIATQPPYIITVPNSDDK